MEGSNATAIESASKNAVAKPPSKDHLFRVTTHTAKIGHSNVKICGFANGISNAAPARKGRSSSSRRKRAMPSSNTSPICAEQPQWQHHPYRPGRSAQHQRSVRRISLTALQRQNARHRVGILTVRQERSRCPVLDRIPPSYAGSYLLLMGGEKPDKETY